LWSFHITRAEYQAAQAVAEQLFDLAERQHDRILLLRAHDALAASLYQVGAFARARTHWEQGIALDDPLWHATPDTIPGSTRNYGLDCRSHLALVLWTLGYPDQAMQRNQEALSMAQALAHPFGLVNALILSAHLHYCRREWQTAQAHAEAAIALATE